MDERIVSGYETDPLNLLQILDFYVINAPVSGVSNRGRAFAEFGWRAGKVNTLQALMRKISSLKDAWICDKADSLEAHLKRLADDGKPPREHAVYAKGGSKKNGTKTKALFYGVRCALAHGRFLVPKKEDLVGTSLKIAITETCVAISFRRRQPCCNGGM